MMSEDLLGILFSEDDKKIKKFFNEQKAKINKLEPEQQLNALKNFTKFAGDLLKSLSDKIKESNKQKIKNFKLKSEYLQELIDELAELCVKINPKGCDGSGSSENSTGLSLAIGKCIESIKSYKDAYEKNELDDIKKRNDIANILDAFSELCKLADKTIETVDTLCDILKLVTKIVSMIHPILLQMREIGVKFELKITKEFNDIVTSIAKQEIEMEKKGKNINKDNGRGMGSI